MEWQPIESAPKDGSMLVANEACITVAFRDSGMSSYRFFSSQSERDINFKPTHWMPLPASPQEG